MEKIVKCKCCGKPFQRRYAPEKYCCQECKEHSRKQQNRIKASNWYHRNKHRLSEKQRWGLGSGYLHEHRRDDFKKEHKSIMNEYQRLRIKPKR